MYRSITALNHKVWFLCLMILVIGWSGVSYAFAASQHLSKASSVGVSQHELMPDCHTGSKAQVDLGKNHLKPDLSNADLGMDDHLKHVQHSADHAQHAQVSQHQQVHDLNRHCQHDQASPSTHIINVDGQSMGQELAQVQQQQHVKCHECSTFHCQNLSSSLDRAEIAAVQPCIELQVYSEHSNYIAKHLSGHWQDILRPPKA